MFTVLQLLKSAQMQHGLRQRDYTRYRYMMVFLILYLIGNFSFSSFSLKPFVDVVEFGVTVSFMFVVE